MLMIIYKLVSTSKAELVVCNANDLYDKLRWPEGLESTIKSGLIVDQTNLIDVLNRNCNGGVKYYNYDCWQDISVLVKPKRAC